MPKKEILKMRLKRFDGSADGLPIKLDGEAGSFEAVFATLNVKDHDGDVIVPGAIGSQRVQLSVYNHGSHYEGAAALPIGVGDIFERGDEAIIKGEFDMSDPVAVRHYEKIKYLVDKGFPQEWSFALRDIKGQWGQHDGDGVFFIQSVKVPEVSPVLEGAGIDTRVLSIKSRDGLRLEDEISEVLEAVDALNKRLAEVAALRENEGRKDFPEAKRERFAELADALEKAAHVAAAFSETTETGRVALDSAFLRLTESQLQLQEIVSNG